MRRGGQPGVPRRVWTRAKGNRVGAFIVVYGAFDDDQFAGLSTLADRQDCSMAEAIRLAVTWGLERLEEAA